MYICIIVVIIEVKVGTPVIFNNVNNTSTYCYRIVTIHYLVKIVGTQNVKILRHFYVNKFYFQHLYLPMISSSGMFVAATFTS